MSEDVTTEPLRSILLSVDAAYASGELALAQRLPRGERGDTLADFIHLEISDVVQGCDDASEAAQEALRSLERAERELQMVADRILLLPAHASVEEVLKAVDLAYHNGEGRIAEDLPTGERGDTLAEFIRSEIIEVCEDEVAPARCAWGAIDDGCEDLKNCIQALEADFGITDKPRMRIGA